MQIMSEKRRVEVKLAEAIFHNLANRFRAASQCAHDMGNDVAKKSAEHRAARFARIAHRCRIRLANDAEQRCRKAS